MPIRLGDAPQNVTPTPVGTLVSDMGPLDGFSFTSSVNERNNAHFIKIKSRDNKAFNLNTGKVVIFDENDRGIPVQLSINAA